MLLTNDPAKSFLTILFSALAVLFLLLPQQLQAQTPVTEIENASGDSVFVSFDDGALLGLGEFNTGVIPAEGVGTRLMWYPAKAAFRAGEVSGTQWDDTNIGFFSVAFGQDATASGHRSMAMGNGTSASGDQSAAFGFQTTASGVSSAALGGGTTASGTSSAAMGGSTTAATDFSLSIGTFNDSNTSADNSLFVVGNGSSGARSDAFVVKDDGALLALGEFFTGVIPAEGNGTRMMWYPAKAAFRAGYVNGTDWDDANIGDYSVAFGHSTEASGGVSTAMGNGTTASGPSATAMGSGTTAATGGSLSIGKYNSANTSADGSLFVVGNGTFSTSSDALVLDDAGNMTIAGTLTESSDRRLKNDITPLENGVLDKLGNIMPAKFQFKNQQTHPAGPQIGLIAQNVQNQFPELVSEGTGGYLSVSYSKFTAVLLKGLQEQQQKIENQQATIDQLEKKTRRIAALEKQVSEIKQNRRTAGLPVSAVGFLLLGIAIGGGFWWQSGRERSRQT